MGFPGKWNEGLKSAVPWWSNFDPYPFGNGSLVAVTFGLNLYGLSSGSTTCGSTLRRVVAGGEAFACGNKWEGTPSTAKPPIQVRIRGKLRKNSIRRAN